MNRSLVHGLLLIALAASTAAATAGIYSKASDDAFGRGVELYGLRKYAEAIPFFQKADSLDRVDNVVDQPESSYPILWIASCYYQMGDVGKAREMDPYSYMLPPVDRRLTTESDSLAQVYYRMIEQGEIEKAIEAATRCAEAEKRVLGENSYFYANSLSNIAECYAMAGDLETALKKGKEALKIYRACSYEYGAANCYALLGQVSIDIEDDGPEAAYGYLQLAYDRFLASGYKTEAANMLIQMAICKSQIGEKEDAYELCLKANEAVEKDNLYADQPESYATLLSMMAQAEQGLLMFDEAFSHATEAKKIYEQADITYFDGYLLNEYIRASTSLYASGCDHPAVLKESRESFTRFAENIVDPLPPKWLERLYLRCNPDGIPFETLIARQRTLLKEWEELEGYKSSNYLEVLADMLDEYSSLSDTGLQEIMPLYNEIKSLEGEMQGMDLYDGTRLLKNISSMEYAFFGDANKAIATLKGGIDMLRRCGWQYTIPYCGLLNQIAQLYIYSEQYYEAYECLHEAMEVYALAEQNADASDIRHSDEYINTLTQTAIYYINSGNTTRANEYVERLRELDPQIIDNNANLFAYELSSVVGSSIDDEVKARKLEQMLTGYLKSMEKTDGNDLSYHAMNLLYAGSLIAEGRNDEAAGLIQETLQRAQSSYGGIAMAMIVCEIACAQMMVYNGNLSEAKELFIKALSTADSIQLAAPQFIASAYQNLADIYVTEGRYDDAKPYVTKILQMYRDVLNGNFRSMSYRERCALWDKFSNWFTAVLPSIAYRLKSHEIDCELFNSVLMSKGYLLNSEIELRKLVAASGDEYSTALYDEVQKLYARQKSTTGNPQEYERITREIEAKERELATSVKAFGDYTKNLTLTWGDVEDALSPDEAAIEFVVTPLSQKEIVYSALLLKADTEPKRVDLCTQEQLTAIPADRLYTTAELANLIWGPLEEDLKDVKNIYFAPQGLLYNTAIEYAPTADGYISDKHNLYRLSSTREIVLPHRQSKAKSAALYGGLDYDADTTAVIKANHEQPDLGVSKPRAALESIRDMEPQGISNLKYTLEEVEEIERLYSAAQEECHSFKGIYGTEESFKRLSGTGKTLLHLATHGFYYTQADNDSYSSILAQTMGTLDESLISIEDKMLTRSGLFLTGANTALTDQSIPATMEDGILTAQEIAFLDFRDVDLVVLSACKSAMGELGGDGVFGLQRGFKKAGAKTLLMSLWNVDDRATKLLMTEFYKNWLGTNGDKMPKREAFLKAQEYLRTTEDGKYSDPEYWAAFIMLDGIN